MQNRDLPADEICLLACARMLEIHISVDYNTGCWPTFEGTVTNHYYIMEVSNFHFIYKGSCKYNLLCRNYELKTIGRKLLDYKLYKMDLTKPLRIVLTQIEDLLDNTGNLEHAIYDSDNTELYYQSTSDDTELYYQSDIPTLEGQIVSDSELTEIYEPPMDSKAKNNKIDNKRQHINEKCNKRKRKSNSGKNKLGSKKQLFKCKTKNCMMILESRKDLYLHHKSTHKGLHKCTICKKTIQDTI